MSRIFKPETLQLYLVLDPGLYGGAEGMIETARRAAAGGATMIQLRAPNWKKRALVECARELKKILAP
ncbi:MAG: thiamine phosphate synthase, partial [Succinivibrionaceae bacterium]|nr:thiamine phosphate synthase [Succinivibrionaceae bacterium]